MHGHKTERKVQNINRKIVKTESKWIPLIHICMPAHFYYDGRFWSLTYMTTSFHYDGRFWSLTYMTTSSHYDGRFWSLTYMTTSCHYDGRFWSLIHICMPAHFSDLVQVLQENVAGLNYYKGPKSPIIQDCNMSIKNYDLRHLYPMLSSPGRLYI
jgi:hypothetical protein